MNPSEPPFHAKPAESSSPARKSRWLFWTLGCFLGVMFLAGTVIAATLWWVQRPIKPVVLTAAETASLENRLRQFQAHATPVGARLAQSPVAAQELKPAQPEDHVYVPGSKVLRLTERELNGLLNSNTDLGKKLRIELGRDAINAYLAVPIPQDFPIGGGKMFRARGRFAVSLGETGRPFAILEDVTVFGLSLPKAWLGGIKGENLISAAVGEGKSPTLEGIKSLRIEPGRLVLEVED